MRHRLLIGQFVAALAAAVPTFGPAPAAAQEAGAFDWRDDWELAEGFAMEIDTEGYRFPAHIVFVPDPGPGPDDPLYFIVELKGAVKVVTQSRTVHTFAENFIPNPLGERFVPVGAAGICLDPDRGNVFVTFAYLDDTHTYRNGMARFASQPGRFGLKAGASRLFLDLFKEELSATSHQIGPCQVKGDHLYVAVGYGEDRSQSQNLRSTLGSVIRMTTDFEPLEDNPFYEDDGQDTAIDYIWAYGFRNPFGLKFVGDRLFVTENGGKIDRFNEIEEGENYLWDGTDWGIGARAAQVFAPSIGVVDLEYLPESNALFPQNYRGRFFAAASGAPGAEGQGTKGERSVIMLDYNFAERRMNRAPEHLLMFRGEGQQVPVSVAVGPDGLYVVPLLPNRAGSSAVLKVHYDPVAGYPHRLGASETPLALINRYECRQCHVIDGQGGSAGPPLDSRLVPRLAERLNDPAYEQRVAEVDAYESEPFVLYRDARQAILASTGEERVRRWLPAYLREPRFDNPVVEMPNLGITEAHANLLAQHLLRPTTKEPERFGVLDRIRFAVARLLPDLRYRHLVYSFILGAMATTAVLAGAYAFFRRRARRR